MVLVAGTEDGGQDREAGKGRTAGSAHVNTVAFREEAPSSSSWVSTQALQTSQSGSSGSTFRFPGLFLLCLVGQGAVGLSFPKGATGLRAPR